MQLDTTPVRAGAGMPDEVLGALHAAEAALVTTPHPSPVHGTLAQWAEVVAVAQRVVNRAVAVQDEGMVALAAIEAEVLDDGTVVESHRAPGHVALDAPAIVSGALSLSSRHAEHRVRSAVRLAADAPAGSSTATGLRALHDAMAVGRLDSYRAGVLADELEEAPPEVAAAVVQSLESFFDAETGPQLRSRCRRVLATISPDLVRQRATKAREQCGLRRWAEEPGVDKWEGTFPSEDAARAWAAIDARAQQLRADGTCPRIERARAQALIDLVTASATITTVLTLTVPAAAVGGDDEAAPTGTTADAVPDAPTDDPIDASDGQVQRAAEGRMPHIAEQRAPLGAQGQAPSATEARACGATDADEPRSTGAASSVTSPNDLVEVAVSGIAQPVFVTREFLEIVGRAVESRTATTACHPGTGALLGFAGSSAYRPPCAVVALVKQRDGRCRFPGCHVAARFCDLDHVRPWPSGPTSPTNLICLCRRHHRIKQRLGWTLRLAVDGTCTCTWTDPTGRVRTTSAVDALHTVVLHAPAGASDADSPQEPRRGNTDAETGEYASSASESKSDSRTMYDLLGRMGDLHSGLEFTLEHHAAAVTSADRMRAVALRSASLHSPGHRTRLTVDVHRPHAHRPRADRLVLARAWADPPGHRTSRRCPRTDRSAEGDEPPF